MVWFLSKEGIVKHEIEGKVNELKTAKQGTLAYVWQMISGFKGLALLIGTTIVLWFKSKGDATSAHYIELVLGIVYPGPHEGPIVDPSALLAAIGTFGTVFHAAYKAYQLRKAGVPAQFLNSIPPAAVDVKLLQAADAAGIVVPEPPPVVVTLVSTPAPPAPKP